MIDQFFSALIFPALLVILLARITYNRFVAIILITMLIAASVKLGYTQSWLIMVDAFSITIGFVVATMMLKRLQSAGKSD